MIVRWFEENAIVSWIAVISIAIGIFIISSVPYYGGFPGGPTFPLAFLYHFFAFFFLNAFLLLATVRGTKLTLIPYASIVSIAYAAIDEFHQFFVPGRYFSYNDIFIDIFGILYSIVIYLLVIKTRKA